MYSAYSRQPGAAPSKPSSGSATTRERGSRGRQIDTYIYIYIHTYEYILMVITHICIIIINEGEGAGDHSGQPRSHSEHYFKQLFRCLYGMI